MFFKRVAFDNHYRNNNKLIIEILDGHKNCFFDLFEYPKTYNEFFINSTQFTNEDIYQLGNDFCFDVMINPYFDEKVQGHLKTINESFKNIRGIIKECNDKYYLLIYASTRSYPTNGASDDIDDTFYIHGIWEVEISSEIRKLIE